MQLARYFNKLSPRLLLGPILIIASLTVLVLSANAPVSNRDEADWLSRLARTGDSNAQLQLGLAYREGRYGLEPDAKLSRYWLTKAAKGGNAYAADAVANTYASRHQMEQAQHWWQLAAYEGNADAELHFGEQLLSHEQNEQAELWLCKAADKGVTRAHQDLLKLYRKINLPPADLHRGENPVAVLAEQMDSTSIKTAFALWHSIEASSTSRQSAEALKTRAGQGDPVAEYALAMRYFDGSWAVQRNPEKAMQWLRRSAAAGNPIAAKTLTEVKYSHKDEMLVSQAANGGNRI
jgi:TPR repeat protein